MAKIRPFKAIRPTRDKVQLVATRPYYTYKKHVLQAKLDSNPMTLLHILLPEYGKDSKTEPYSNERFAMVGDAYHDFINRGILVQDQEEHLYLYRQRVGDKEYMGIIGGASVDEYKNNLIKKHEATITSRQEMFTRYLNIVGYNAEPVLLSYSDAENEVDHLMYNKIKERPEYEFTTTDMVTHEMWVFTQDESESIVQAFDKVGATYICDGHHRSASSAGISAWRNEKGIGHYPNENHFLAYFINEKRLKILEFNRLVKTLNGHTEEEFILKLKESFKIEALIGDEKPKCEHEITMCLRGQWYKLTCDERTIDYTHPVNSLDCEILTQRVLEPLLGIEDLKTDDNISFESGTLPLRQIENKIRSGEFEVGFFLYPLSINDIKKVADNNMTMPPKSTWVEPKLRSGLTIYNINE